jgi:hypothetical protein
MYSCNCCTGQAWIGRLDTLIAEIERMMAERADAE